MIVTVFASNILGDGLPSNALRLGMHNNFNSCYEVVWLYISIYFHYRDIKHVISCCF